MSPLNTLLTLINQHPGMAYIVVFLISLSESLAVVGLLVPGTVLMFGVGAIVATGSLGLMPVLVLAMLGTIAGDGFSYWIGRHYQEKLKDIWPLSRYPELFTKGEPSFFAMVAKVSCSGVLWVRFVRSFLLWREPGDGDCFPASR